MDNTHKCRPRTKKRTLPKTRSILSSVLIGTVGCIFLIVATLMANRETVQSRTDVFAITLCMSTALIYGLEILNRILLSFEEYTHLNTRYQNNKFTFIKDMIYFSRSVVIIFVVFTLSIGVYIFTKFSNNPVILFYNFGPMTAFMSIGGVLMLTRIFKLDCGPLYDSLWIENSNGLDYGSSMAHSFFHGYLKLIIPKTGTTEKYLEDLMEEYEAKHHVKLEFYKLFILIPKSLFCPASLMNQEYSPSIEESSSLAEKQMTVAGVQNRIYKNSVYKIKSERGKKIYVCAEYATPLKTFRDVTQYNGEHSNNYHKHKSDIVLQFYLTLQKILREHVNCTQFCELVFYDDIDENGQYKDVGEVLLQRLRKLKKGIKKPVAEKT